jgi:hypothetical protein
MSNLYNLVRRIKYDPKKSQFYGICDQFVYYLNHTSTMGFRLNGQCREGGGLVEHWIPYIHRWTPVYVRSILAKFYKLEEWLEENPSPVSMLSLTTYQDGDYSVKHRGHLVSIPESFMILNEGRKKLLDVIKNKIRKGLDYVWVLEPHLENDTGYPHLHSMMFTELTDKEKKRIEDLWVVNYNAASRKHGVEFTVKPIEESIKSMRNYFVKYIAKTFVDTGSRYGSPEWTAGQLVFNSVAWRYHYRLWGSSHNLTKVMARHSDDIYNIDWFKTTLLDGESEIAEIWRADEYKIELIRKYFQYYLKELESLSFI